MRQHKFEYGPISRGTYRALLLVIALVALYFPEYFGHYLLGLLFLGVGLRPLLERTGLYDGWVQMELAISERWYRKFLKKRAMEVDRRVRDEKYRKTRLRDPKLPWNW